MAEAGAGAEVRCSGQPGEERVAVDDVDEASKQPLPPASLAPPVFGRSNASKEERGWRAAETAAERRAGVVPVALSGRRAQSKGEEGT